VADRNCPPWCTAKHDETEPYDASLHVASVARVAEDRQGSTLVTATRDDAYQAGPGTPKVLVTKTRGCRPQVALPAADARALAAVLYDLDTWQEVAEFVAALRAGADLVDPPALEGGETDA
jgi:hypothetical protein